MLTCSLSAKGCPETFSVLVSMFSDLRNPCEAFSKPWLFVMVRDMRPNNFKKPANSQGVVGNMSSKTTTELSVWSQSASRRL